MNYETLSAVAERWGELVDVIGQDVASIAYGVVKTYGKYGGWDLVDMTHMERTPWKKAYHAGHNKVIPTESIRQFYRNLKPDDDRR